MPGSFFRDSILLKWRSPIGAKEENLKRSLLEVGKGMCGEGYGCLDTLFANGEAGVLP